MSHLRTLIHPFALSILAVMSLAHCARLGEAAVTFSEQNLLPAQEIVPGKTKPGMGANGGPITWDFWVKTRTATADAMLGSFEPFYKLNATRLAVSTNFVLYRDSSSGAISTLPISRGGNTTSGSPTVSGLSATNDILVDMQVTGSGIPAGTYVKKITDASTIELTNNASSTGSPVLDFSSPAVALLNTMERAYTSLKNVYGAGEHPYANNAARIVILAYNIQDDYTTTGNYVGGYFSPRDLFSNEFTQRLYTDPVALQQYSGLIGTLGGYSNEMSIINYDLDPGYADKPNQVNDIVIHELSHLFTYSKRVVKNRLANHDLWIAEGIAENAADQTQRTTYSNLHAVQALRLTQLASPSTIDYYQDAPQLTDFLTWAPKIVGYLQSNLFFNYFRHRAEMQAAGSATTMMTQLMTMNDQTINGVETLIQSYVPGQTFASLYGDFVITHYLMMLGIALEPTAGMNGAAVNVNQYSFANVGIGSSSATIGGSILSKYPATIPFNFEAPKCADGSYGLKPNSYFIFRHMFNGNQTPPDTPGSGAVAGELPLKYVINMRTENSILAGGATPEIRFRTYDAGTMIPMATFTSQSPATYNWTANDIVHIIVYNPNKTGSCRALDNNMIRRRNHSKWAGSNSYGTQPSPDLYWQTDTGAPWLNNTNGSYYRPGGIASFISSYPNNALFVVDYTNMSLQKINMDTGEPLGRLGSTAASCPSTGAGWSLAVNRYVNNYCAHTFDAPQGVYAEGAPARSGNTTAADSTVSGLSATADLRVGYCVYGANVPVGSKVASIVNASTITLSQNATATGAGSLQFGCVYVADSNNRRIVQYDMAGNFIGWLGLNGVGNDVWQGAATVTDQNTLLTNGAATDPRMFQVPWTLTGDGTDLYVVDYGSHRIIRRNMNTGAFVSYIGNGNNTWNTSTAPQTGNFDSIAGYLRKPKGIAYAGGNLYIADEANQRVVRVNSSGAWTGWIGNGLDGWQVTFPGTPTPGSRAAKDFLNPSGIATDGTYLYVADRLNNRISRWVVASGNFAGWIGHGRVGWEMSASAPASDPYGGVSLYPPEYYAEPHAVTVVTAAQKGTRNDYLYITSVYNGRVTRINLTCVNSPGDPNACAPLYDPTVP